VGTVLGGQPLTGVTASGAVGSVSYSTSVALSGVQAAGSVGNVVAIYWILVDSSETANWQNVNNAQSAGWSLVDNAETSDWVLVDTD
jgi:hypothetical protein